MKGFPEFYEILTEILDELKQINKHLVNITVNGVEQDE